MIDEAGNGVAKGKKISYRASRYISISDKTKSEGKVQWMK